MHLCMYIIVYSHDQLTSTRALTIFKLPFSIAISMGHLPSGSCIDEKISIVMNTIMKLRGTGLYQHEHV